LNKGTTFRIYLPFADQSVERVDEQVASSKSVRGSETILVVEDDTNLLDLITTILESAGYDVRAASTATEALGVFEQQKDRLALLISDVVMPEMSGPDLSRLLLESKPDLKLLFLSGYLDSSTFHRSGLNELTILLQKPFTPTVLTEKVREILDSAESVQMY
jgi:DNA-binding NtrC family response regulator